MPTSNGKFSYQINSQRNKTQFSTTKKEKEKKEEEKRGGGGIKLFIQDNVSLTKLSVRPVINHHLFDRIIC